MNAYDKAISLLKIRPHHTEEIAKKLLMRGFGREEVVAAIEKLADQKLIDNESFVQNYLDELLRTKTFGFYGLKNKLMQRGMASNDAEKLLRENLSIEKEIEIAEKVAEREERSGTRADKIKLAQKLQRKGFRSEVIQKVINTTTWFPIA